MSRPMDVLAVLAELQSAVESEYAGIGNRDLTGTNLIARGIEARAAVAELIAERDRLQAKLDTNQCNRGHETLPLVLWDCPECHAETKRQLAELIDAAKPFDALYQPDGPISHWDREDDSRPVFGVNKATVTLGDFRRLRRALEALEASTTNPTLKR